jgi:hypothetical protein
MTGVVRGFRYTEWPQGVRQLKRDGAVDLALEILYECIDAAEQERNGREPAPWYTHEAAVIHRGRKEFAAEVAILERWENACPPGERGTGAMQSKLAERLAKARLLLHGNGVASNRSTEG